MSSRSPGGSFDSRTCAEPCSSTSASGFSTAVSFTVRSGAAQEIRTEPFQIVGLTSFGEDAAGELYATASNGVVYRLSNR